MALGNIGQNGGHLLPSIRINELIAVLLICLIQCQMISYSTAIPVLAHTPGHESSQVKDTVTLESVTVAASSAQTNEEPKDLSTVYINTNKDTSKSKTLSVIFATESNQQTSIQTEEIDSSTESPKNEEPKDLSTVHINTNTDTSISKTLSVIFATESHQETSAQTDEMDNSTEFPEDSDKGKSREEREIKFDDLGPCKNPYNLEDKFKKLNIRHQNSPLFLRIVNDKKEQKNFHPINQNLTRGKRETVDLETRAMCPWEYKMNSDPNRYPSDIPEAECLCDNSCSPGNNGENMCKEIPRHFQVLRRTACYNGQYVYKVVHEKITVGCVCTTS